MEGADFATLPEDILRLIAEYYLRHGHGFKQWCKVASAFPGLSDIPLPRVTLSQLAQERLPWGGKQNLLPKEKFKDKFSLPRAENMPGRRGAEAC